MTRYLDAYSHVDRDEEGRVGGKRVKQILMRTGLPTPLLSRIWLLADRDADGKLARNEFILAMHLAQQGLQSRTLPDCVPDTLVSFIAKVAPPVTAATAPATAAPAASATSATTTAAPLSAAAGPGGSSGGARWVVTPAEKKTFDEFFAIHDADRDGYVTGNDVMSTFMSSKLPKADLKRVWDLCDISKTGRLNAEQFALAMFLISHKVKGMELPTALTDEHIPPSLRTTRGTDEQSVKTTPALSSIKLSPGTDASGLRADIEKLRALKRQKEEELAELQGERSSMASALALTRQQEESDKRALAALGPARPDPSVDSLKTTQAELAALLAEESKLRSALTTSRSQLGALQERMAQSRNGTARSQSLSISRFANHRT